MLWVVRLIFLCLDWLFGWLVRWCFGFDLACVDVGWFGCKLDCVGGVVFVVIHCSLSYLDCWWCVVFVYICVFVGWVWWCM